MSLESDVLRRIKPTKAQDAKVAKAVKALREKVLREARTRDVHIEIMLVGSVAKGTHLRDPDIDMFMLFPESTPLAALKEKGLEIGRAVIDGREHYAQHPYVRGEFKEFQVDLVPCFKIRDTRKKMSAVDRTPFHTQFVKSNLTPSKADQVRMLKRFMKGIGCYGAEAKVQGFSGYLCELLIMRYGSFGAALEAGSGWSRGEHLELEDFPGGEFREPLTFVDPVDAARNVASAVSLETMLRFIRACREYLASPSAEFFYPCERKPWNARALRDAAGPRLDNIVGIVLREIDLIDDVLWPQLRKSLVSARGLLKRNDFETESSSIHVGNGKMYLLMELKSIALPGERRHRGPPSTADPHHVQEFIARWRDGGISQPFEEDGRWYVIARREYLRADELLRSELRALRLGKDLQRLDDIKIVTGPEMLENGNLAALTAHFDERMPWEVAEAGTDEVRKRQG